MNWSWEIRGWKFLILGEYFDPWGLHKKAELSAFWKLNFLNAVASSWGYDFVYLFGSWADRIINKEFSSLWWSCLLSPLPFTFPHPNESYYIKYEALESNLSRLFSPSEFIKADLTPEKNTNWIHSFNKSHK